MLCGSLSTPLFGANVDYYSGLRARPELIGNWNIAESKKKFCTRRPQHLRDRTFFDPVGTLQIHELIAQVRQRFGMAVKAVPVQILPNAIEHRGDGAEIVFLLDVKI
jgi:hypothetical protein